MQLHSGKLGCRHLLLVDLPAVELVLQNEHAIFQLLDLLGVLQVLDPQRFDASVELLHGGLVGPSMSTGGQQPRSCQSYGALSKRHTRSPWDHSVVRQFGTKTDLFTDGNPR